MARFTDTMLRVNSPDVTVTPPRYKRRLNAVVMRVGRGFQNHWF